MSFIEFNVNNANERVYIDQELTPKERMNENELRQELKHRRLAGESDIAIRNDKIIKKAKFPINQNEKIKQ